TPLPNMGRAAGSGVAAHETAPAPKLIVSQDTEPLTAGTPFKAKSEKLVGGGKSGPMPSIRARSNSNGRKPGGSGSGGSWLVSKKKWPGSLPKLEDKSSGVPLNENVNVGAGVIPS